MANFSQDNPSVDLDLAAKLHAGYDASVEFRETGTVFSRADFQKSRRAAPLVDGWAIMRNLSELIAHIAPGLSARDAVAGIEKAFERIAAPERDGRAPVGTGDAHADVSGGRVPNLADLAAKGGVAQLTVAIGGADGSGTARGSGVAGRADHKATDHQDSHESNLAQGHSHSRFIEIPGTGGDPGSGDNTGSNPGNGNPGGGGDPGHGDSGNGNPNGGNPGNGHPGNGNPGNGSPGNGGPGGGPSGGNPGNGNPGGNTGGNNPGGNDPGHGGGQPGSPAGPQPPLLSLSVGLAVEDHPIPLSIAVDAISPAATTSIVVGGVPPGATLSAGVANADGTWTLGLGDLPGLCMIPPLHGSGAVMLDVAVTTMAAGLTASASASVNLVIEGVATPPSLSVASAAGVEDTPVALTIGAALADTDGSETLCVRIGNLPPGSSLSAGVRNGDGTWTLVPAQLAGLTLTPPPHFSGRIDLAVTAISAENGTTAQVTATLPVILAGVANPPVLSLPVCAGAEDTAIGLTIGVAAQAGEAVEVTIGNLPPGTTLSAGIRNADGSWTLTAAQLAGLTMTPPLHASGDYALAVTATASENGTTATTSSTLRVEVAGVATPPTVAVQAATGVEGSAIPLHIDAALVDTDGSETLAVRIAGVPSGIALSAGTHNADGSWTLAAGDLAGLTLNTPMHWAGNLNLTVTAISSENGTTAQAAAILPVTVTSAGTTMPVVTVQVAAGLEDIAIGLHIDAAFAGIGGAAALQIGIGNLPPGASLSAGTHNADGSWTLSASDLPGLTLTPPTNYSGHIELSVTASAMEGGTTVSANALLDVTVEGVADTPLLSVQAASGNEDSPIALHINAALADTDGSESLSIAVGGVPAGASLSAGIDNGDGTWTLTVSQLVGLTLTPPANWSGTLTLSVAAASAENGTYATSVIALPVTVAPVADAPSISVAAGLGLENSAIPLTINAMLSDASETLGVFIAGLPAGASLSAGVYAGNGSWALAASELTGLTVTPPQGFCGTLNLSATATSTTGNGDCASLTVPVSVTVVPVVEAPLLTLAAAAGREDVGAALNIAATLPNEVVASESLSITVAGVPAGAALSAGVNAGGGVWTLTAADLVNLRLTPGGMGDARFDLTVTATGHASNGATASATGTLPVVIAGIAHAPTIGAASTIGVVNTPVPLTVSANAGGGSETATVLIHGVPDGFALNHGCNNGDNSWTLARGDLAGLTLIAPPTFQGQLNLYAQAVSHAASGDVALSAAVPFHACIGDYAHGYLVDLGVDAHVGGIGVGVQVGALPDIDLFPASGGIMQTGGIYMKEDTTFAITDAPQLLNLGVLNGLSGQVAAVDFGGIPAGVTFSARINKGGGVWELSAPQLTGLKMTCPADSDVDFTITSVARLLGGLGTIALTSTAVHVQGVADMPTLTASVDATVENQEAALHIAGASTDRDGSEIVTFLVSGMPSGFSLNHGIDNGNGTWSLQASELSGLTVTPAHGFSGAANLTVSAIATETARPGDNEGDSCVRQATLTLNVTAVADAPVVAPVAAHGAEGQAVALDLGVALSDTDGSETIAHITVGGLPPGAALSAGALQADGTYTLTPGQLAGLTLLLGAHWHGDAALTVTATAQESANGATASASATLPVHVEAVAGTPILSTTNATGMAGQAIDLHLGVTAADAGEHVSAVIAGVPQGVALSAGVSDGHGGWALTPAELATVRVTPAGQFMGDLHLTLTAFGREDNGSTAQASQNFTVHVLANGGAAAIPGGGWIDAVTHDAGGTVLHLQTTSADDAHAAIGAAETVAHAAGSDYQHAFQAQHHG